MAVCRAVAYAEIRLERYGKRQKEIERETERRTFCCRVGNFVYNS